MSLLDRMDRFFGDERAEGRLPVFVRFFLSDAQNQIAALRSAWEAWPQTQAMAISIVEQPPLDGSRIAALVQTASGKNNRLFHSLRLREEEAYVRDIDSNYAGLVKARNDVFAEEGLSHDTHYIASTGIGGATEGRNAVVAIDFLTRPDIRESDKTYLKALSHLSPTHDYGVAFERGVRLSDGQIFISGTASIDSRGRVLHEGDVVAQADRLLENISELLREGGSRLDRVPYFVIYLRDISDYPVIDAYMQERFPAVPRILLEARVCRPSWLIEMECEVAQ